MKILQVQTEHVSANTITAPSHLHQAENPVVQRCGDGSVVKDRGDGGKRSIGYMGKD